MGLLLFEDRSDVPSTVLPHHMRPFLSHSSDSDPFFSFDPNSAATSCSPDPPRRFSCLFDAGTPGHFSAQLPAKAVRKRSHDEFTTSTVGCEEDDAAVPSLPTSKDPIEEPIYGEGMTLLNPRSGMAVSAESQTGTWFEEKMETTTASAVAVSIDPTDQSSHRGRKSQRLDSTAAGFDDITAAAIQRKLNQPSAQAISFHTPPSVSPASSSSPAEPAVDDLTKLLGISWQRMSSDDPDIAPAVRGWERYIDKHYAGYIQAPRIVLKHHGLNAYLVTSSPVVFTCSVPTSTHSCGDDSTMPIDHAGEMRTELSPGFYLFSEDLSEARLVANDWETCVHRLRTTPIMFADDSETLKATTAGPLEGVQDVGGGHEGTEAVGAQMFAAEHGAGGQEVGLDVTMDIDP